MARARELGESVLGTTSPNPAVGAVVLDADGALAAATSTGGRRAQAPGRVGDSPIIGAGTFADGSVAVSATGNGEVMIAVCGAHEVSALMRHAGMTLAEACEVVVRDLVGPLGGEIGLIALDAAGNSAMRFDTTVMHRGWKLGDGPVETAVLR